MARGLPVLALTASLLSLLSGAARPSLKGQAAFLKCTILTALRACQTSSFTRHSYSHDSAGLWRKCLTKVLEKSDDKGLLTILSQIWDQRFESAFLQRGVECEPDFLDHSYRQWLILTSMQTTTYRPAAMRRSSSPAFLPIGPILSSVALTWSRINLSLTFHSRFYIG
jgi:hypothetical protein